jgi:peptide deformylase
MIRPICRDIFLLGQKSVPATEADLPVAQDLLDTLKAHETECVGMAANMIGVSKRIIVIDSGMINMAMLNPAITRKSGKFTTEEGCLSLDGVRETTRYRDIEVTYQDMNMKNQKKKFTGWTAQIIQHECDHLDGIII